MKIPFKMIYDQLNHYSIPIPKKANTEDILQFQKLFSETFGYEMDEHYIDLTRQMNGVEFNGFTIYPCVKNEFNSSILNENIIDANKNWIDGDESLREKTIFGESDLDLYVKNLESGKYEIISKYSDEVFEQFDSFEELITGGINKYFS